MIMYKMIVKTFPYQNTESFPLLLALKKKMFTFTNLSQHSGRNSRQGTKVKTEQTNSRMRGIKLAPSMDNLTVHL